MKDDKGMVASYEPRGEEGLIAMWAGPFPSVPLFLHVYNGDSPHGG